MMVVGKYGLITTSTDGVNWTQKASGSMQHLADVTAAVYGEPMMSVGMYNTITIPEDGGETWEANGFDYNKDDIISVT